MSKSQSALTMRSVITGRKSGRTKQRSSIGRKHNRQQRRRKPWSLWIPSEKHPEHPAYTHPTVTTSYRSRPEQGDTFELHYSSYPKLQEPRFIQAWSISTAGQNTPNSMPPNPRIPEAPHPNKEPPTRLNPGTRPRHPRDPRWFNYPNPASTSN